MKKVLLILTVFIFIPVLLTHSNDRYDKWNSPGFFKGYNVLYESFKSLQDFIDFKNYGGNFMHIGIDGFMKEDPPYNIQQNNIDGTDLLVNFCREAGIYYAIAVRSGPGAYDTYDESQGNTGESRIWNTGNTIEQQKYADMLNMIVSRYANDTLFVGLNLIVEPRPKVRLIPANNSETYKMFLEVFFNIHMDDVYNFLISEIRKNDSTLPIITENFGYSTPELFPAYELDDPYVVYSTHNYQPKEFTNSSTEYSLTYPGIYWNLTFLALKYYDAAFMRDVVLGRVKEFQELTGGKPVFLGEFGIFLPQNGSNTYIYDVLDVCKDYGWHFALWDWRRGSGKQWNIENFNDDSLAGNNLSSWETVLSFFNAPPVPVMISPVDNNQADVPVVFKWDSLTSHTFYDIEVYGEDELLFNDSNIKANSTYSNADVSYIEGKHYKWRIRAKNPGGNVENASQWSEYEDFYIPASSAPQTDNKSEFKLKGNYPNPFNPSTVISYYVPVSSYVTLTIYDMLGREVNTLVNSNLPQGNYNIRFDGSNLSSGVYVYKLSAEYNNSVIYNEVRRMVLIK